MLHNIKFEWTRLIGSRGWKLAFFVAMILSIANTIMMQSWNEWQIEQELDVYPVNVLEAWMPMEYQFVFRSLFYVLFPILATLPMGASFYRDIRTGYIKNICIKSSNTSYFVAKYLVAFIAGFLVIFVPLLLDLMVNMLLFPCLPPQPFAYQGIVLDGHFMAEIYYQWPVLYAILYSVVDGMFAGIISVSSLCISRYLKSAFTVIIVPFVVYVMADMGLHTFGMDGLSIYRMVDPVREYAVTTSTIIVTIIFGIGITSWWFCHKERRKDVL